MKAIFLQLEVTLTCTKNCVASKAYDEEVNFIEIIFISCGCQGLPSLLLWEHLTPMFTKCFIQGLGINIFISVKKGADVKAAMKYVQSHEPHKLISETMKEDNFQYASFQSPDKINNAYRFIGVMNIFEEVARRWPGPGTTSENLKRRLQVFYKRRNQIAHEGDLDSSHNVRVITPDYSKQCKEFIEALVSKLDDIVFPAP